MSDAVPLPAGWAAVAVRAVRPSAFAGRCPLAAVVVAGAWFALSSGSSDLDYLATVRQAQLTRAELDAARTLSFSTG